jgi:hypothetical protein
MNLIVVFQGYRGETIMIETREEIIELDKGGSEEIIKT